MLLLMTFDFIPSVPPFATVVVVVASAAAVAAGQKWLLAHATQTVLGGWLCFAPPDDDDVPLLLGLLLSINVFFFSSVLSGRLFVCLNWSGLELVVGWWRWCFLIL